MVEIQKPKGRAAEKQKGFRFSTRTINNLRALIDDLGVVRNETEAVDLALEHMVTELTTIRAINIERELKAKNAPFRCRYETAMPQAQGLICI